MILIISKGIHHSSQNEFRLTQFTFQKEAFKFHHSSLSLISKIDLLTTNEALEGALNLEKESAGLCLLAEILSLFAAVIMRFPTAEVVFSLFPELPGRRSVGNGEASVLGGLLMST